MRQAAVPELSVVIPVYNEGRVICRNLKSVDDYLQTLMISYEIVIVNDGSKDNTLEQASGMAKERIRLISYAQNRGKGFAVKRGMMEAGGRFRLFMDMDLSTDLAEIPKFLQHMREGLCDICVGNRHSVGVLRQKRPWYRALMGKSFALMSKAASGCPVDDFTCGFKIFTGRACVLVFAHQRIYNWAFDTELLAIANRLGLRVGQLPVVWQHHAQSKVRIGPAVVTAMMDLGRIWHYRRSIKPESS